jgi:hypothetical protein
MSVSILMPPVPHLRQIIQDASSSKSTSSGYLRPSFNLASYKESTKQIKGQKQRSLWRLLTWPYYKDSGEALEGWRWVQVTKGGTFYQPQGDGSFLGNVFEFSQLRWGSHLALNSSKISWTAQWIIFCAQGVWLGNKPSRFNIGDWDHIKYHITHTHAHTHMCIYIYISRDGLEIALYQCPFQKPNLKVPDTRTMWLCDYVR